MFIKVGLALRSIKLKIHSDIEIMPTWSPLSIKEGFDRPGTSPTAAISCSCWLGGGRHGLGDEVGVLEHRREQIQGRFGTFVGEPVDDLFRLRLPIGHRDYRVGQGHLEDS